MRLRNLCCVGAALVSAGCGARLSDAQVAALDARGGPTGSAEQAASAAAATSSGAVAPGPGGGAAPSDGTSGAPSSAAAPDSSAAAASGSGESATACVPTPSDEVGITDGSITLGEVTTTTGPIPGLGQTGVNGVRAYLAYRNSQGGVCGRTIELSVADDRFDTGENRAATARLMSETFGLVGGWSAIDDGGAGALAGSNVPDVGLAISDARFALPNNFSPNPITQGESGARPILRYMAETYQVSSAAVVWAASPVPRTRARAYADDLAALGIDVVVESEVAVTETNYVAVAQQIENSGAQLVITAMEITGIARLAQAFRQVDYLPAVPFYGAQTYGNSFLELAGDAADGAIIGITHPIIEEAAGNPQVATFLEWYQRVNPGAAIDYFSFQGWVAASMMADALEAAGPAPTRDGVLAALRTFNAYDADGLVAPFDPAGKRNTACFLIVTVENGEWRRLHPADGGFACP